MEITRESVGALVEKYGSTVLRLAYTYLNNMADAEDTVQDVFLKIMDKAPEFRDEEHERYWIVRTTINMCKNRLNMFWNKNKRSIDEVAETAVYDKYSEDSTVLQAVLSLPGNYKAAVYMYYYEGWTTPQIAKMTGKSEITVRSYLHRARTMLKKILKEEYDFEQEI